MKTTEEAKAMLANEIKLWFRRQVENPTIEFALYYIPRKAEHSGGLAIRVNPPPNVEYIRAAVMRIDETQEQAWNRLWPIVAKLPILGG